MVVLTPGCRGSHVARLQLLLNTAMRPTPPLRVDGHYGRLTLAVVERFQREHNMTADGRVDDRVWALLGMRPGSIAAEQASVSSTATPRWYQIAEAELGVHENAEPGQHNQRIIEYHSATSLRAHEDEVPWCASFVNWVMRQAGIPGTNSALAASWLDWGTFIDSGRIGAVTVIRRIGFRRDAATGSWTGNHVGFFVSLEGNRLRLLGGNQSDSVRFSNFNLDAYEIRGFRWPQE